MPLIMLLLILLILSGGLGFGGFVALGTFDLLVKILFLVILVSLVLSLARYPWGGPSPYV